jgi:hypothetical protein
MSMPLKSVEAVVESLFTDELPPWLITSLPGGTFFRLHGGMSDEEVGLFFFTACAYNQLPLQADAIQTIQAFLTETQENGLVMPGGLHFAEASEVKVVPGCSSGLEDWREWLAVPFGQKYVWAGHDPTPEVEYNEFGVRIWQDRPADGVSFIDFDLDALGKQMKQIEIDMKGLLKRVKEWANYVAPGSGESLADCFAQHLKI